MAIKTISTCPLGSVCEEVKDGEVHRCAWYTEIAGKDPQTGKDINQSYCAMAILPKLIIENTGKQIRTGSAIESFRNEMKSDNRVLTDVLSKVNTFPTISKDITGYLEDKE